MSAPPQRHGRDIPARGPATDAPVSLGVLGLLGVVLFGVLARAVVSHEPTPWFGFDPAVQAPPPVGMGPTRSLQLDAITLLASSGLLVLLARRGRSISLGSIALATVGAAFALVHGLIVDGLHIESLRIGASWCSAIFAAVAIWHVAREPRLRSLVTAALLCFAVPLIAKGAMQVVIEHPATVAEFEANQASMLAAQGMTPGSPQALSFERRLRQPDPTGWFGLTNVFLSIVASCGLGLAIALRSVWRSAGASSQQGARLGRLIVAASAAGAAGLLLAGPLSGGTLAKGPAAAVSLAAALLGAAWWLQRRSRPTWWLGLVAIGIPLAAVITRGLLGDRLEELSLWFRWFYMIGAAKVIAEAPLLGVGPDGFQAAYLLAKPPISPEQVASPHSVLLDWLATLGIGGVAWCCLFLAGAIRVCSSLQDEPDGIENAPPSWSDARRGGWLLGLVIVAAAVFHLALEAAPLALSVDGGSVLLVASVAQWVFIAALTIGLGLTLQRFATPSTLRRGSGAAALVLLAHSQIEMTLTTTGSAGWAMALIALAAAGPPATAVRRAQLSRTAVSAAPALVAAVLLVVSFGPIGRWESLQRQAGQTVAEVTADRQAMRRAAGLQPQDQATFMRHAGRLARRAGVSPSLPPAEIVGRARLDAFDRAAPVMRNAVEAGRQPLSAMNSLTTLYLSAAEQADRLGQDASGWADLAVDNAEQAAARWPGRTSAWNQLAIASRERWARRGDESDAQRARQALVEGQRLDPHGLSFAWSLFELAERRGDAEDAALWAAAAIEAHERLRLDPVALLSEERLRRALRAVR